MYIETVKYITLQKNYTVRNKVGRTKYFFSLSLVYSYFDGNSFATFIVNQEIKNVFQILFLLHRFGSKCLKIQFINSTKSCFL